MVQVFSRCILCSNDEIDLDELLAAKLVSFLMDNYQEILSVPSALKSSIEDHIVHLQRVQVSIQWKASYVSLFLDWIYSLFSEDQQFLKDFVLSLLPFEELINFDYWYSTISLCLNEAKQILNLFRDKNSWICFPVCPRYLPMEGASYVCGGEEHGIIIKCFH